MFVLLYGSLDVYEGVWACFTLEVPTDRLRHRESSKFTFLPKSHASRALLHEFLVRGGPQQ